MNKRKEFKKKVIELVHWLPYEEAKEKELVRGAYLNGWWISWGIVADYDKDEVRYSHWADHIRIISRKEALEVLYIEITLAKICEALRKKYWIWEKAQISDWKLITDNWNEATDDDQTDEKIERLCNLL